MDQPRISKVSYQDYFGWSDENRWEIIDGEPYLMSPSPRTNHQRLVTALWLAISQCLSGKPCEAFVAPLDVKLSHYDVVQPDVMVVCDSQQVTEACIEGPPTLVVEILSPSSLRHDRIRKLNLYAKFGVQEYWIVTPEPAMLEILALSDGGYRIAAVYTEKDTVKSPTLEGVEFAAESVFGPPVDYPDEVRETPPPVYAGD